MTDYLPKNAKIAVPLIGTPEPGREIAWLIEAVRAFEMASFEEAQNDVDFTAQWNAILASSGIGVADGDKGDIVVTVDGTVWTFDPSVVSAFARLLLAAADAPAARTVLGLGSAATQSASAFAAAVHTHPSSDITGLDEAIDDRVAVLIVPGTGISATYNDGANTLTISATGGAARLTQLQRSTTQSVANNTSTAVSWDTTPIIDDVAAFDVGSPTRITVPSGYTKMKLRFWGSFAGNSSGIRAVFILKNGATEIESHIDGTLSVDVHRHMVETMWLTVTPGDYFTCQLYQNSGGSLNTSINDGYVPYAEAEWRA